MMIQNNGTDVGNGPLETKISRPPPHGTAWPPMRDSPGHKSNSATVTCTASEWQKTSNKPGHGTDGRPNPLRQWTYEHGEGKNKDAAQAAYWYEKSIVLTPDDDVLDNANYVKDYKLKPLLDRYHFGAAANLSSPS